MRALLNISRLLPVLLSFTLSHYAEAEEPQPTISVSGNAEIRVVPDQVVLTAAVESRAKSVAQACTDNSGKIRGIIQFLKEAGIEEQHIHTEYVSIEPIMRQTGRSFSKGNVQSANNAPAQDEDPFGGSSVLTLEQPIGYLASRQFAITLIDLRKFEDIYRGLIEGGINRVRGIEFRTSELRKHRDAARLQAVRAAEEKARAMSQELGAKLAAIKTVTESGSAGYGTHATQNSFGDPFGNGRGEPSELFAVGQITVRAAVDIVFYLGDAEMED